MVRVKTKHPPSVNENYLVKRSLKLEGNSDIPWDQIESEIDQRMGIDDVHLDKAGLSITISYDASFKSLEDIEKALDQNFLKTASDWCTGFKLSWYEYTDDNLKESARHEPWSCHSNR